MDTITLDDIASSLKLKKDYVRDKVVKRPDFPRPAVSLSQKTRRWNPDDFNAWMQSQKSRLAR